MKKLNKKQSAEWSDIKNDVANAYSALELAVADYNAALEKASTFRDDLVSAMEDYVGERSDRWQESDAANEYEDWKSSWDQVELGEVQIDDMPDLDLEEAVS